MKLRISCLFVVFGCATVALAQTTAWAVRHVDGYRRGQLYTVDLASGASSPVGTATFPYDHGDLTYDWSNGKLYAVSGFGSSAFYEIDPSTGVATLIGSTGALDLCALTYDPATGNLYAWRVLGFEAGLHTVDRTTGRATFVGLNNLPLYGLTVNSRTNELVGLDNWGVFWAIDRTTGAYAYNIGYNHFGPCSTYGLTHVAPQRAYFTITEYGYLIRNDDRTLECTVIASGLGPMDGLAVVPEPATLVGLGLGALALAARRRLR